jgi:hypothetical protein
VSAAVILFMVSALRALAACASAAMLDRPAVNNA